MKLFPFDNRYRVFKNGKIKGPKGKVLKPAINSKSGYCYVSINKKSWKVHRVIAFTFFKNFKQSEDINHWNGIKTDNRFVNLRRSFDSDNISHSFRIGLRTHVGIKNPRAKLTTDQVEVIRMRLKNKETLKSIAFDYGLCFQTISRIKYGQNWKILDRIISIYTN